jgi:hypothetical protein
MVQKKPGGLWEDYGVGTLATGKTGLCGLRHRLFMTGAVATGTAFRLSNKWRTGGGIELHGDTA